MVPAAIDAPTLPCFGSRLVSFVSPCVCRWSGYLSPGMRLHPTSSLPHTGCAGCWSGESVLLTFTPRSFLPRMPATASGTRWPTRVPLWRRSRRCDHRDGVLSCSRCSCRADRDGGRRTCPRAGRAVRWSRAPRLRSHDSLAWVRRWPRSGSRGCRTRSASAAAAGYPLRRLAVPFLLTAVAFNATTAFAWSGATTLSNGVAGVLLIGIGPPGGHGRAVPPHIEAQKLLDNGPHFFQ